MNTVQLISIMLALLFLLQVVVLTSKNKLQDQQAFLWLIFAIVSIGIAISLPKINQLAIILGITYMPSLIFSLAFFVVLSLLMYQTIVLSKQQDRIKALSQEFAYLKKEMDDMNHHLLSEENQHDSY